MKKMHHVLLMEDDPATVEFVTAALVQYNFRVSSVTDGQLALSRLRTQAYDLILCDIMLPHLDGLAALARAKEHLHATPVVIISALSDKDSVMRAREAGAGGYLRKPFTLEQLLERVLEVLRLKKADLINKRDFPFHAGVERHESGLRLQITGCPMGSPVRELFAKVSDTMARFPTSKKISIIVPEEFAYDPRALEYLSSLASMLSKNAGVSRLQIEFSGSFFQASEREETARFRETWHVVD